MDNYAPQKHTSCFIHRQTKLVGDVLTHWGRVTHICVSELPIIGSDNGMSPGRRQAINWTNGGILLIRTLGINFSEILSEIHAFSFKKMHLKMSSGKWRPFCLGLNVLICHFILWNHSRGMACTIIDKISLTIVSLHYNNGLEYHLW